MPYAGIDDGALPPKVKAMGAADRRVWVGAFNGSYEDCRKQGGGGCEGRAFAVAYSAVRKTTKEVMVMEQEGEKAGKVLSDANAKAMMEALKNLASIMKRAGMDMEMDMGEEAQGEKCMGMPGSPLPYPTAVEIVEPSKPYGGAQSFGDLRKHRDAVNTESAVSDLTHAYRMIVGNIFDDCELSMSEKADKISTASQELANLLSNPDAGMRKVGFKELVGKAVSGVLDRVLPGSKETKTEGGVDFPSAAYAYVPDTDKPSTWKLRLWEDLEKKETAAQVGRAVAAFSPGGFRGQKVDIPAEDVGGVKAKIRKAWKQTHSKEDMENMPSHIKEAELVAFKAANGQWRWIASPTNKFEDKSKEVLTEAAHREYVAYVDATKDYPELWLWHTPGTRIGQADFVDYCDGFLVTSGPFDDPVMAERVASKADGLALSHGFSYREKDRSLEGEFQRYRMKEITILPSHRPANRWTLLNTILMEVKEMPFKPEKRTFLVDMMGEERTAQLEQGLSFLGKELEEAGVRFKTDEEEDKPVPDAGEADPVAGVGEGNKPVPVLDSEAVVSAVKELVTQELSGIKQLLTDVSTRLIALEKSDDEKIAQALSPKQKEATPSNGNRPSADGSNVVTDAKEIKELEKQSLDSSLSNSLVGPYISMLKGQAQ